jgi:hypothetical protein
MMSWYGGQQLVPDLQRRFEGDPGFLPREHDLGDVGDLAALVPSLSRSARSWLALTPSSADLSASPNPPPARSPAEPRSSAWFRAAP